MNLSLDEPIAALASPPGSAARGILRLSGGDVRAVLAEWFEPQDGDAWQHMRVAAIHAGVLKLPHARVPIPVEAHLWPNHRSYTGQPTVELHLSGSPPLLEAVLAELHRRGARPARPGEFTLRAFLAGRLDLLQAEAVLGVIDAHDHVELQAALAQLAGGLSGRLADLRHDLLELLADLEAGLDFIEEDIEFVGRGELIHRIALARRFVEDLLQQSSDRMQSRTRATVVLAGLPNAGKSTLFNRLAGSDAALVSTHEGTTRDFLSAAVDWRGLAFDLIDTAGWELAATGIAQAAQKQRSDQFDAADVLLWCSSITLDNQQRLLDEQLFAEAAALSRSSVRVLTQLDRVDPAQTLQMPPQSDTAISAVTEVGLDTLADLLRSRLSSPRGSARQWLGMTAARCRESLAAIAESLVRAEATAASTSSGDELLAIDLREALDHLGRILGTVYTDDILDRVFSKFCIGK
ncbi:MAG: 50S ribosome-binding GTPase [Planctomycetales bacterium]|nr:50S ribosome-binding GTPase [Planctomycetales bacterium]